MLEALPQPRVYTELRKGDHVRIIVRDPRDRLLSAWRWFTKHHNCYIKPILEKDKEAHEFILNSKAPFRQWAETALQHWNPHWAPQSEIHPRWREFHLLTLDTLPEGWGHREKTRSAAEREQWREYYDVDLLELVNTIYSEDIEMWKEADKNGFNTRTKRVL
jgi:hypothetical protein